MPPPLPRASRDGVAHGRLTAKGRLATAGWSDHKIGQEDGERRARHRPGAPTVSGRTEEHFDEIDAYCGHSFRLRAFGVPGIVTGIDGDAEEHQGDRRNHARLPR